jgi:cell division cycle protein 37
LEESYKFLSSHPELVNQANSDEVMAQGFTYEMEGKTKLCKNAVFQALLLQYSALLGKDGVSLFFSR